VSAANGGTCMVSLRENTVLIDLEVNCGLATTSRRDGLLNDICKRNIADTDAYIVSILFSGRLRVCLVRTS